MQVALNVQTQPPSPIPQNSESTKEAVWKWQPPDHPGGMWELRRLTDEELNYGADEGKTEQELVASVAMAAARWHRIASNHQPPPTLTPTLTSPPNIYQAPCDAKNVEPVASDDAFSAKKMLIEENHNSGGETHATSYVDQTADSYRFESAEVNGVAPGVLFRDRTAEPRIIAGSGHPQPTHEVPSSTLKDPIPVPAFHITSLQSPPTSPRALLSVAEGIFESYAASGGASASLVASPVAPLVSSHSPDFLKRRRASTTAMYDYEHGASTSYNDDNAMKRSKSSSTAICHPKKRKISANFIKSIESDASYPMYTPRASSTFSCSSELSTGSNYYSSSASSSQEDSYKSRPERRHHCNLCSASFARGHDLRRHERTHTNVRDHKCSVCGREFSRRDALQRHTGVCDGQRKAGKKNSTTTSAKRNVSAGPVSKKARKTK